MIEAPVIEPVAANLVERRQPRLVVAYRAALVALVALGATAVLRVWWAGHGLWNDEAAVAINLRDTSWWGLTKGLEYLQVAPIGWLWLEKAVLTALGPANATMRLISALGALATLILAPLVARRAAGRLAALLTAAAMDIAPLLLKFTGELKQYTVEAGVAAGLLLLGGWMHRRLEQDPHRRSLAAAWIGLTLLAVLVSLTAVLVLFGVVVGIMLVTALDRRWRDAIWLGAASLPAGLFAGYLVYRRVQYPFFGGQTDYFRHGVPPKGSGLGDVIAWLPRMWSSFVGLTLGWRLAPLVFALVLIGLVALWRRGRPVWAAMLGGTILAGVGAAAVRALPVTDRVALYLIAPVVVLVAAGLDGLVRLCVAQWPKRDSSLGGAALGGAATPGGAMAGRRRRVAVAGLSVALLAGAVGGQGYAVGAAAAASFAQPTGRDSFDDALAAVASRVQPGDVVLVYWFSDKVYRWHQMATPVPMVGFARLFERGSEGCSSPRLAEALAGARRVFYLESRVQSADPSNYFALVLAELSTRGFVLESYPAWGDPRQGRSAWALVDLAETPQPLPQVTPNRGNVTCLGIDPARPATLR